MALTKVGKEGITGISNASDATAITIDSSEKVGIGTASPSRALSTKSSSVTVGNFESTSSTAGFVSFSDANTTNDVTVRVGAVGDNLVLQSGGSERMKIDSSGNVGINDVPVSGVTFSVKSLTNIHPAKFTITTAATGVLVDQLATSGTRVFHDFRINNAVKGKIQSVDGNSTNYATTSDYRLKENVVTEWDATTRLKQLKPSRFNFIENPNNTVDGFLAHEVSAIVPEAVSGTKDAVEVWREGEELPDGISVGDNKLDDDGNTIPDMQGIDQSKLVPLLVKTIQELEARITALESA